MCIKSTLIQMFMLILKITERDNEVTDYIGFKKKHEMKMQNNQSAAFQT